MVLYSEDRHQQLASIPWSEDAARREIREIVRDTEAALQIGTWWPQHPRDDHPANAPADKTLYLGAVGVMWALEFLASQKAAGLARSYEKLWYAAWQDYQSTPDTEEVVPSWFLGESAPALLCMLHGPATHRAAAADRLFEVITANSANPTWEILWGSPGTMLAALFAYEATQDSRWLDLYRKNAERLWNEWSYSEDLQCHIWTQDLYQNKQILYGAGHGFAGNAFALLRGITVFSTHQQETLLSRIAETTKRLTIRSGSLVNWPSSPSTGSKPDKMLLQWCHGAPGFLLAVASRFPLGKDRELDQLFLEAGELIWQAGPLVKGACFCHGTDGNGMALLTLFKRTGDIKWLNRARTFAMQAMQQSQEGLKTYGRRRYTLWTGDLGLAIFLQACIDKTPHMPALDFL